MPKNWFENRNNYLNDMFLSFTPLQVLNLQPAVTKTMVLNLTLFIWKITGIKEAQPKIKFSSLMLPVKTKRYLVIFLSKYLTGKSAKSFSINQFLTFSFRYWKQRSYEWSTNHRRYLIRIKWRTFDCLRWRLHRMHGGVQKQVHMPFIDFKKIFWIFWLVHTLRPSLKFPVLPTGSKPAQISYS